MLVPERPVEYVRPSNTADASALLSRDATVALGGGTDLLVTMREGLVRPNALVDLRARRFHDVPAGVRAREQSGRTGDE